MVNKKDFPDFPGLLVSDPREWNNARFGADMGGPATAVMPLISTVSPANGGLQQFSRPVNLYNGQQWPVKIGMDAYPATLQSVLDDNPKAAGWAAAGSVLGPLTNDIERMFGIFGGGDKDYSVSHQIIHDNYPGIAEMGEKAEEYAKKKAGL